MTEHIVRTVEDLASQIQTKESELIRLKRTTNDLCRMAGIPPKYADSELEMQAVAGSIRSDQFYGRPLATVIREYLQMRRVTGQGPASPVQIYDALVAGGYVFDTKEEANAKRGLRESLTKNPIFHRLPNSGDYGLLEWYPNAKADKKPKGDEKPAQAESAEASGDGEKSAEVKPTA